MLSQIISSIIITLTKVLQDNKENTMPYQTSTPTPLKGNLIATNNHKYRINMKSNEKSDTKFKKNQQMKNSQMQSKLAFGSKSSRGI